MSEHKVTVLRVTVEPHENADSLELVRVGDYLSVVRKGQFSNGSLVAYIPEQSLLPASLVAELGLEGKLAGPQGNRVKSVRLRGVLSQGLVYPARPEWIEGQDVTSELGVSKWQPPIPSHLSGEVFPAGQDKCLKYDIENIKRYPDVFLEGEPVVLTEKIHGTWLSVGVLPPSMEDSTYGNVLVSSKGLSNQGLAFKLFEPNPKIRPDQNLTQEMKDPNGKNLYVRTVRSLDLASKIREYVVSTGFSGPVYVLGEVFGRGVQDLSYGASTSSDLEVGFRAFDVFVGRPGSPESRFLNDQELDQALGSMQIPRVPVLYRGPYTKSLVEQFTSGKETVSGKVLHIREGVVVRPVQERRNDLIGRVQLKSVSADYLLRKGDTTEYQ